MIDAPEMVFLVLRLPGLNYMLILFWGIHVNDIECSNDFFHFIFNINFPPLAFAVAPLKWSLVSTFIIDLLIFITVCILINGFVFKSSFYFLLYQKIKKTTSNRANS